MRRYIVALLVVCVLPGAMLGAQAPAASTPSKSEILQIDGSKNPELIPNGVYGATSQSHSCPTGQETAYVRPIVHAESLTLRTRPHGYRLAHGNKSNSSQGGCQCSVY